MEWIVKLAILGAAGRTGTQIVNAALAAGHEVVALVRDAGKLGALRDRVTVVEGSAVDRDSVRRAITGADAVLVAVGTGGGTMAGVATCLVAAMPEAGVRRVVSLVGAGVAVEGDPESLGRTIMRFAMGLLARDMLDDATEHARILRSSSLDWTLVRPPRLADGEPTGRVKHAPALVLGPGDSITRADLARFMLEAAVTGAYLRQAPMVANSKG
jgi:putative NADH-flavin reductase